ncbi:MAG: VCBS repeat-containing protein, partial [Saprospiraceae bacterium]
MRNFFYVPFFCLLWMHQAFAQIQPEIKVVNSPSNLAKVQPIDWDNDGDSDLLIFDNQDTAYSKLSWLEHLSNGLLSSLQPLDSIHAPANTLYWVSSNDFNNDGRL